VAPSLGATVAQCSVYKLRDIELKGAPVLHCRTVAVKQLSNRAASEHVRKCLLLYIQFVWVRGIGTKLDLTRKCQKMSCKLGYRLFLHTILCQRYLP